MPIKIDTNKQEKPTPGTSTSISKLVELLNKDITLGGKKMNDKKKERFFSELSILLSSGIDIKTAFEIIIEQQENKNDKELFNQFYQSIIQGDSLSQVLEKSKLFTPYDYNSIKIGEETGRIGVVLNDLAMFYAKKIKQKRQLTSAFSYPALVMCTAFAAVYFMMAYMVPMFEDIFSRSNTRLPGITRAIVKISGFVSSYSWYFWILVIVFIVFVYSVRHKQVYRRISSGLSMKIPYIGTIIKMVYLEKYFQSMALLIGSKVTMLRSIKLVRDMIGFYPLEEALDSIQDDIMHGVLLHQSMGKFHLFNKRICSLVKVGEEVNKLDSIFEKLAKQYSEELEHKISLLGSVLEPILIIFIGIFVAIILISMYLPMFQMGGTVF